MPTEADLKNGTTSLPPIEYALFGHWVFSLFDEVADSKKGLLISPTSFGKIVRSLQNNFPKDLSDLGTNLISLHSVKVISWWNDSQISNRLYDALDRYDRSLDDRIIPSRLYFENVANAQAVETRRLETANLFRQLETEFYAVGELLNLPQTRLDTLFASVSEEYDPAFLNDLTQPLPLVQMMGSLQGYAEKIRRYLNFLQAHRLFLQVEDEFEGEQAFSRRRFFEAADRSYRRSGFLVDAYVDEVGDKKVYWNLDHLDFRPSENPYQAERPNAVPSIRYLMPADVTDDTNLRGFVRLSVSEQSKSYSIPARFAARREEIVQGFMMQLAEHWGVDVRTINIQYAFESDSSTAPRAEELDPFSLETTYQLIDGTLHIPIGASNYMPQSVEQFRALVRQAFDDVRRSISIDPVALLPLSERVLKIKAYEDEVAFRAVDHARLVSDGINKMMNSLDFVVFGDSTSREESQKAIVTFVKYVRLMGPTADRLLNKQTDLTPGEFRLYGDFVYSLFGLSDGLFYKEGVMDRLCRNLERIVEGDKKRAAIDRSSDRSSLIVAYEDVMSNLHQSLSTFEVVTNWIEESGALEFDRRILDLLLNGSGAGQHLALGGHVANNATSLGLIKALRAQFHTLLQSLGFESEDLQAWQEEFDTFFSNRYAALSIVESDAFSDDEEADFFPREMAFTKKFLNLVTAHQARIASGVGDPEKQNLSERLAQALESNSFIRFHLADAYRTFDSKGQSVSWTATRPPHRAVADGDGVFTYFYRTFEKYDVLDRAYRYLRPNEIRILAVGPGNLEVQSAEAQTAILQGVRLQLAEHHGISLDQILVQQLSQEAQGSRTRTSEASLARYKALAARKMPVFANPARAPRSVGLYLVR